ncbi:MAG TPA: FAD-binding oxidoreductase [Rhizomicrobium sp.]|nr:FAD-binding oxidoreductase [Rhizomicrobium sp.]
MPYRSVALFAVLTCVCLATVASATQTVNDVTQLNPIVVEKVVSPHSAAEIARLLRAHSGPVCIGGARHSQGGQIATRNCLFLDMREMNRVLDLDLKNHRIRVEAGASWRKIQEAIDPHGLSLRIMQTYANFTVGGSLSVNAHGRYVGEGAIVRSVEAITIVLADGTIVSASRSRHRDIFDAAIGGYGGIGVIVDATLDLVPNTHIRRVARRVSVSQYRDYFLANVRNAPDAVFHNADLYPPDFRTLTAVTWVKTDAPLTNRQRLAPLGEPSSFDRFLLEWLSRGPLGKQIREYIYDPAQYSAANVEWRNYEASYDAASLEPASREKYTYGLQEYFVPVKNFEAFAVALARILRTSHANVLNVSIRHARPDRETLLSWSPQEVFAFVLYFGQGVSPAEREQVHAWTAQLIAESLRDGGTYYLPYQIVATREQFLRAYPRAPEFFALKARVDPTCKFRNELWDRYDDMPACKSRVAH